MSIVYSVAGPELTNGTAAVDDSQQAAVKTARDDSGGLVNGDATGTSAVECDSFCEFVRFEGTVTDHCVPVKMLTSNDAGSFALLRLCIDKYKSLFEALVAARILRDNQSLSASFIDQFVSSEALATSCESTNVGQSRCLDKVELAGLTKTMVESFSLACQQLVDFSALPIYTESTVSSPDDNGPGKNAHSNKLTNASRQM